MTSDNINSHAPSFLLGQEVVSLADDYTNGNDYSFDDYNQYPGDNDLQTLFQINTNGFHQFTPINGGNLIEESFSVNPASITHSATPDEVIDPQLRELPVDATSFSIYGQIDSIQQTTEQESSHRIWDLPPKGHIFWTTFPFEKYMAAVQHVSKGYDTAEVQLAEFGDTGLLDNPFHNQLQLLVEQYPETVEANSTYSYQHAVTQANDLPIGNRLGQLFTPDHNALGHVFDINYAHQPQPIGALSLLDTSTMHLGHQSMNQSLVATPVPHDPSLTRDNSMVPPTADATRKRSADLRWPTEDKPDRGNTPDETVKPRRKQAVKRISKNNRNKNMRSFDPLKDYKNIPEQKQPWGGEHNTLFTYRSDGGLEEWFPPNVMAYYLLNKFGGPTPISTTLEQHRPVILIQCAPADSSSRYYSAAADKCKFENCPVPNGTIRMGTYRVAFDEFNDITVDPFRAAGYAHLFCVEYFLDFGEIVRKCNIQPDVRRLPEGPNRMCITGRDTVNGPSTVTLIDTFINKLRRGAPATGHQGTEWDYTKTLTSIITENYFVHEADTRENVRLEREQKDGKSKRSNHIGCHRNNLFLWVKGEEFKSFHKGPEIQAEMLRELIASAPANVVIPEADEENYFKILGHIAFADSLKKPSQPSRKRQLEQISESGSTAAFESGQKERPIKRLKINTSVSTDVPAHATARTTRSQTRQASTANSGKKSDEASPLSAVSAISIRSTRSRKGSQYSLFGSPLKSAVTDDGYVALTTRSRKSSKQSNNTSRRSSRMLKELELTMKL